MPGSKRHTRVEDLENYLDDEFPGAEVIPRTDQNSECIIYYPETGYVIARGSSNGDALEKITDPDFVPEYKRQEGMLDNEVKPKVDLKNRAENLANYLMGAAKELRAILKKDPRFVYHENGEISIKAGDQTFKKK